MKNSIYNYETAAKISIFQIFLNYKNYFDINDYILTYLYYPRLNCHLNIELN